MKVVILGGTGQLGRAVLAAADRMNHTLTVMARNAAALTPPVVGVRMVIGDVTDAADVERAIAGQDAVVWTVRAVPVRHGADAFEAGIPHVIAAMREHRVARLVCVACAGGARPVRERFSPSRLRHMGLRGMPLADADLRESPVRESGLAWTVVRTATLTNAQGTGLYQTLDVVPPAPKRIACADVAAFIVDNLAAPDYVHRTVVLAG